MRMTYNPLTWLSRDTRFNGRSAPSSSNNGWLNAIIANKLIRMAILFTSRYHISLSSIYSCISISLYELFYLIYFVKKVFRKVETRQLNTVADPEIRQGPRNWNLCRLGCPYFLDIFFQKSRRDNDSIVSILTRNPGLLLVKPHLPYYELIDFFIS